MPHLRVFGFLSCAILFLAPLASGVTFTIPPNDIFCAYQELYTNQQFLGVYVVSGYDENSVIASVESPEPSEVLYSSEKSNEGQWDLYTERDGEYKVCFNNYAETQVFLTLEMISDDELSVPFAADSIDLVGIALTETFDQLKTVTNNLNFQKTREYIHGVNLGGLDSQIQWSSFFKVLSLISIALGQAYILTGFLNTKARRFV